MASNIQLVRICQECRKSFIAKTTLTKFCGLPCNRKNYKKRIKLAKIETSNLETIEKIQQKKKDPSQEYLSISEACSLLSVSRTTLWRLIKKEQIKATKIGGRSIVSRQSIDKLFD
jgi:excisionase family DNA binding protein